MRVDNFLKVSRILKRRTVANTACQGGRVLVNDKAVKPGHSLKIGDRVTVVFGESQVKFVVKSLNEKPRGSEIETLYEIIE